jgi:hypothetical protein
MNDPINVANLCIDAYNKDFAALRNMMTHDIHIEHHNCAESFQQPS